MKKTFILAGLFLTIVLKAQVGINTSDPQVTFEVASNDINSSVLDGIIAPRINVDILSNKVYSEKQLGAIIYINELSQNPRTWQTNNISEVGYYYFDGNQWKKFYKEIDYTQFLTREGTGHDRPLTGSIRFEGGDTYLQNGNLGFYSSVDDGSLIKVSGLGIQNDGDVLPSLYYSEGNNINNLEMMNFIEVMRDVINIGKPIYDNTWETHYPLEAMKTKELDGGIVTWGAVKKYYSSTKNKAVEENNITVPSPPTTGNYILTSVDGILTWIENKVIEN